MSTFDFRTPSLIVVGGGAWRRAGTEAARLATSRNLPAKALLVTDQNLVRVGHAPMVANSLIAAGLEVEVFAEINTEPTSDHIASGVERLKSSGCGVVVAVGGGAAIDAAKGIAVMATNPGAIGDYIGQDKVSVPKAPLVSIPTTAGTGSEVTRFVVITDTKTGVKFLMGSPLVVSDVALVDYTLTYTSPKEITAGAGLDAFIHALEAFISKRANPLSDSLALSAMGRVAKNIRQAWAHPQDEVAREQMALAALEAGIAFSNASVALIHGMSRPIGAHFHVPHGLSNAMLLPVVARFNQRTASERLAQVAQAMGAGRTAVAAVRGIQALCQDLGIPSVTGYGIAPQSFMDIAPRMAQEAIDSGSPANNPRPATAAQIVRLYRQAL
jgi:alcohol dehydrogenase class IV